MSDTRALAGRIRISIQDVKNSVIRAIELSDKARKSGDDGYWDGVALNLHGFYTGIEHIFEDIAPRWKAACPPAPSGTRICLPKWRVRSKAFVPQ